MQQLSFSSKAADLSDRISAAIADQPGAAAVQRLLRAYPPVWELAQQPAVLEALLEAADHDPLTWWRPARVALQAVAVWRKLPSDQAAQAWLLDQGRPLLLWAAAEAALADLDSELAQMAQEFLAPVLVRDTCLALYHHAQGKPQDWPQLNEGVLISLYDFVSRTGELAWMNAVVRERPETAVRILLLNHSPEQLSQALYPIIANLPGSQLLPFLRALDAAGAPEAAASLSQRLFQALPAPTGGESPEKLAEAAVRHYYRGMAASSGNPDTAVEELQAAWESGRALLSALAYRLGLLFHQQADPLSALSAYQLGMELTPSSIELRASAAAALNDMAQASQALRLLEAAPASQAEQDYNLNWEQARALAALGREEEAIAAAARAADRFSAPEQRHQVAQLLADLGEDQGAIILLEQALAARPDRLAWYRELGELYARQFSWPAAEACFRQLVAMSDREELPSALLRLASAQQAQGKMDDALQLVSQAAHLAPQDLSVLQEWATVAHSAHQWQQVIHAGEAALALEPNQALVHVLMGQASAELGQDQEALYHLRRATQLPVGREAKQPAAAWLALAQFYQDRDQPGQVEEVLNEGMRALPQSHSAPLLFRLGLLYEETGRLTEAHSTYHRLYQAGHQSSALLTHFGRVLGRLGHHQMAVEKLEEAIAQSDADPPAFHTLAQALEGAGRLAEAAAAARQAANLEPTNTDYLLEAGRLNLAVKDIANAVDTLRAAAAGMPKSPAVWEWLGRAHELEDDWEAALDAYWLAARLDPTNPHLQVRIGLACTRLGQHETAITVLKEASARLKRDPAVRDALAEAFEAASWWDKAAVVRQQAAELAPSDMDRLIAWARAARQAGDFPFAEEALARARGLDPNSQKAALESALLKRARGDRPGALQSLRALARDSQQPELLWKAGEILIEMGDADLGAAAFGRAVDLRPEEPAAQVRLAETLTARGDFAQALAAYRAAAELEPKNPAHQVAIGEMQWQLGALSQAAQIWESVLERSPEDPDLMSRLARAYAQMGDPAAALPLFERAAQRIALSQGDAGPIWREAGRAALALAELEKAQLCLTRALQQMPEDPDLHSLIGALADRLGKPAQALESYRRAVQLAPIGARRTYQLQLADALTDQGKDLEALAVWGELAQGGETDSENLPVLAEMGRLYARAGRYASAERTLRSALEQSPDDPDLQLQLASVLIELAEEADFRRRSGLAVPDRDADLQQAVSWLNSDQGERTPPQQRDLARAHLLLGGVNQAILGLNSYLSGLGSAAVTDLNAQRALGVAYRQAGQYPASLDALTTAIKVAPTDLRTAVELAQGYLMGGKAQTALILLERLAEQVPADPILAYHTALAAHRAGEPDKAMAWLEGALESDPGPPTWHRTLAAWLRQAGRPQEALPRAQAAHELETSPENMAELARVLSALGRPGEAIPLWQQALEQAPERPDWWASLGDLSLEIGLWEQAADCFDRAVQLAPQQAGHHLGWAHSLLALDRPEEAGRHIDLALELAPDSPAVHAGRGAWQAALGQWQQALVSFQTAAVRASNGAATPPAEQANYLLQVARAYHALGSSQQALQELERAAQLAPDLGAIYALMGDIYLAQEEQDLARQAYQQAARSSLSSPDYALRLAQFLQAEGQYDQALDWLMKAVAARPSASLWLEAARIYRQRKQRGKHLESLHQAIALDPQCARAHFELGLAYKQRKEYQLAIEKFEKAVDLEPDNQEAHKQLSAVVAISLAATLAGVRTKG